MIVERAPVESRDLFQPPQASIGLPRANGGILTATSRWLSIVPLLAHPLPKPAQAVAFTWRGGAARIVFACG